MCVSHYENIIFIADLLLRLEFQCFFFSGPLPHKWGERKMRGKFNLNIVRNKVCTKWHFWNIIWGPLMFRIKVHTQKMCLMCTTHSPSGWLLFVSPCGGASEAKKYAKILVTIYLLAMKKEQSKHMTLARSNGFSTVSIYYYYYSRHQFVLFSRVRFFSILFLADTRMQIYYSRVSRKLTKNSSKLAAGYVFRMTFVGESVLISFYPYLVIFWLSHQSTNFFIRITT